ncbi:hypothetical protein B9Z19DRAFT_1085640 [Tuber borchii]|uniref:Uncharacterized protein n=1 Tax=Tuber borchii TaxID=42251 RepID=A0A2T6ZQH3_TUBBO|nr:hypothetical protein B9Z19DRAFT_1085640 [Tuber borchii]
MLSKLAERDNSDNQEHGSNAMSPGEVLAIVIAALTLLVAMIPLFRCPRFHRGPLSSISSFVKKALGITLPDSVSTAITTTEDSNSAPAPNISIPRPVFIYNDYSNAHFVGTYFDTFIYSHISITRVDGRALQVEESLGPRRPERAVTYPVP